MTVRLLVSELVKEGSLDPNILGQICTLYEGGVYDACLGSRLTQKACNHAKASRRRPSNPAREQFNAEEFEWFSKNTYNLSVKHGAEMHPKILVRLLSACIEVSKSRIHTSPTINKF